VVPPGHPDRLRGISDREDLLDQAALVVSSLRVLGQITFIPKSQRGQQNDLPAGGFQSTAEHVGHSNVPSLHSQP
jgi:hypothetical protein